MTISPTEELNREFWTSIGGEVKRLKSFMQPLLYNWLLETVDGEWNISPEILKSDANSVDGRIGG